MSDQDEESKMLSLLSQVSAFRKMKSMIRRKTQKENKMFTSTMMVMALATMLLATCGQQVSGSSHSVNKNENSLIKDPVDDLSWLRVLPRRNLQASHSKLSDQKLDAGASALYDSTAMPNDNNNYLSSKSFSGLLSVSSIPSGKRRLDTDSGQLTFATQAEMEALASSGKQSRRIMEAQILREQQQQQQLYSDKKRANSQLDGEDELWSNSRQMNQMHNQNYRNGQQPPASRINGQVQRRSSSSDTDLNEHGGETHRRPQAAHHKRQVIDKRSSVVERKRQGSNMNELDGDDLNDNGFYDENRNLVSNRRSGGVVDKGEERAEKDEEDDDDDLDDDGGVGGKGGRSRQQGGRMNAAPSGRQQRRKMQAQADEDVDVDDDDNDSDESIESAVKSLDLVRDSPVAAHAGVGESEGKRGGNEDEAASQQLVHSSAELQAAAGHHHGHHGHYYQHVEVPKKKAWKFGFKRGNHKHESK